MGFSSLQAIYRLQMDPKTTMITVRKAQATNIFHGNRKKFRNAKVKHPILGWTCLSALWYRQNGAHFIRNRNPLHSFVVALVVLWRCKWAFFGWFIGLYLSTLFGLLIALIAFLSLSWPAACQRVRGGHVEHSFGIRTGSHGSDMMTELIFYIEEYITLFFM